MMTSASAKTNVNLWLASFFMTFILLPGSWSANTNNVGGDSASCDSNSISYKVQSCVPQYLADLWQGQKRLTLGKNHITTQVLRSKLCQEVTETSNCLNGKFHACNINQAEMDTTTRKLLPSLAGLSAMCQQKGSSFSCSEAQLKSCMQLLPPDTTTASSQSYNELCPKLRVADSCFSSYSSCDDDFFKQNLFNAERSWKNDNGVQNNPFFSCNEGVPPSGNKGPDVIKNNVTVETSVDFNCETALNIGVRCSLTMNWYVNNAGSGLNHHKSCHTCGVDNAVACEEGNYFNFSSTSCQSCPQGSKQINGHLCDKSTTDIVTPVDVGDKSTTDIVTPGDVGDSVARLQVTSLLVMTSVMWAAMLAITNI